MWNFVMPALTAVGINSGMNLLRRKPIFENTGTAAVTGGILGGFNGGSLFSSSPTTAAASSAPTSAGAFEASMGLDKAYNAGSLAGLPGSGTIESAMGAANASGTFTNPDYFANILGNQVYTGNDGLLSQIGTGAGSIFDSVQSTLGDELTPQNLLGVSMLMNNMSQARPMPSAGGGREIKGTPPKQERFVTGQVYGRKKRGNA